MATSVYSIRIDSRIRKMMDELPGSECKTEIRALIEDMVRKKLQEQLLARALEWQDTRGSGRSAAGIIREARNAR